MGKKDFLKGKILSRSLVFYFQNTHLFLLSFFRFPHRHIYLLLLLLLLFSLPLLLPCQRRLLCLLQPMQRERNSLEYQTETTTAIAVE